MTSQMHLNLKLVFLQMIQHWFWLTAT